MKWKTRLIVVAANLFSVLALHNVASASTIEEKLSSIPGLTYIEQHSSQLPKGVRYFEIQFTQPVDHQHPNAGTFQQRLALLHRSENEPMVLQTSGYSIARVLPTRLSALFETNQLQVEHRYFAQSRPQNLDWSKLNIQQSADDFHAIVVAFKKIYPGPWVNTGASKGGMTSVFHRYFYPLDVVGTVADVAPLSFSTLDPRYVDFINNVGGENYRECRENFKKMQVKLLQAKDMIVPNLEGNFEQLGGAAVAFEHWVTESHFYFWQYGDPDSVVNGCPALPHNKSHVEIFRFINTAVASINDYTDSQLGVYSPYFYQAATELGSPANAVEHMAGLLNFDFIVDQYTPKGVDYSYTNSMMVAVDQWVRQYAQDIMFIYGEFDPWTAGEYPLSETRKRVYKYYVPKGNHGAKFVNLPQEQYAEAVAKLTRWMNKPPVSLENLATQKTAQDMFLRTPKVHPPLPPQKIYWLEDAELQTFRR